MSRISEFLNDANIIRLLDLNTSTNGTFESDQKENTSEDALHSSKFDWNELFRVLLLLLFVLKIIFKLLST